MKGFGHVPVFGSWLGIRHTRTWADAAVHDGDPLAVRELVRLLLTSASQPVLEIAHAALSSLTEQDAIDTFCTEVLATADPRLVTLARGCRYAPAPESRRALFLFVTSQFAELATLDPLPAHPFLARGYAEASRLEKKCCLDAAQRNHSCQLLGDALREPAWTRPEHRKIEGEWEVVMCGLADARHWDTLWRLLFSAPQPVAIAALHHLRASGWVPTGDDRTIFKKLVGTVPATWTFPATEKQPLRTLENPACHTTLLTFSPAGDLLATAGTDGQCRVWCTKSGTLRFTRQAGTGASRSLAFTPDGRRLICAAHDGCLWCWDATTGTRLWDTHTRPDRASCMLFTPDGAGVISGGVDGVIRVLDGETGEIAQTIGCHTSPISGIALSPDGTRLASANAGGRCSIHTVDDLTGMLECTVRAEPHHHIQFTPDGNRLVVAGGSITPSIFEIPSGAPVPCVEGADRSATSCTISSFEGGLVIGSTAGTISIWHLPSGTRTTVPVYRQGIASTATTPDHALLVVGCNNGTCRLFTLPDGNPVREFAAHAGPVIASAVSPDGTTLASCGWDGTATLRTLPTGELVHTLRHRAGDVTCLCSTPDGSTVITGNTDGTCRFFEPGTGSCTRTLDLYTPLVQALTVNPAGTCLACAGRDNSVHLWRIADGARLFLGEGLTSTLRSLAFTPDGTTLVTGGWDGKVRYWNVADGTLRQTVDGHTGVVLLCAFSSGCSAVVTVAGDATVRLWDPKDGHPTGTVPCSNRPIRACALSPDGFVLALGDKRGMLTVVYLPEGDIVTAGVPIPAQVTALAITRDQQVLIAGYDTGLLALYSLTRLATIRSLQAHSQAITAMVLAGEDLVITSGRDGATRVFSLPVTCPLGETSLAALSRVTGYIRNHPSDLTVSQWRYLEQLLHARFRTEIELCPMQPVAGAYDIQIVG